MNTKSRIFEELYNELDKFTKLSFSEDLSKIVNNLVDMDIRDVVKVVLYTKKINNLGLKSKDSKVYLSKLLKLLKSKNNLCGTDSYPIGQDFCIFSCAARSQNVLNVKRLVEKAKNSKSNDTEFLKYIVNVLNFKNDYIEPCVKDSSPHTHQITWFRLFLRGNNLLETFKSLHSHKLVSDKLCDVHIVTEEFKIIELYYEKKAKRAQLMTFFNECDLVESIIFCSELDLLKRMNARTCDIFSNLLKFYFCYRTNSFSFSINSQQQIRTFHYVYLVCTIFMYTSPKFTNVSSKQYSSNPLSILSGSKPMLKIQDAANKLEPLTPYEEQYVRERGEESLCDTAATKESFQQNKRHEVIGLVQDRDCRMITSTTAIGASNMNELVIVSNDESIKKRIDVLRELSNNVKKL